jgi:hypothetical protein
MDHIFNNSDDENINEKISLDDLYDRKQQVENQRLKVYQTILKRVHTKIRLTAKQRHENHYMFYVVPEFMFGIPRYNVSTCISYIIEKLTENGFEVKYTHPNMLFISWMHYIPSYKRDEIKKKTGKTIDGFGNIIKEKKNNLGFLSKKEEPENLNNLFLNTRKQIEKTPRKKNNDFKDISSYKSIGIYNEDLFNKLKDKIS